MTDQPDRHRSTRLRWLPSVGHWRLGWCLRYRVEFLVGMIAWRDPEVPSLSYITIGCTVVELHLSIDRVLSRRERRRHALNADDGAVLVSEVEDFLAGRGPE